MEAQKSHDWLSPLRVKSHRSNSSVAIATKSPLAGNEKKKGNKFNGTQLTKLSKFYLNQRLRQVTRSLLRLGQTETEMCRRWFVDPWLEFIPKRCHWISRILSRFYPRKIDGEITAQSRQ
jgi:hypothetical protein